MVEEIEMRSIKGMWTLAAILVIAPFPAVGLMMDGNLSDWGVAAPTQQDYNNWTPSLNNTAWMSEDWVMTDEYGEYVGPGYGGQVADAEAMYMHLDGQTLYAAIACGLGPWVDEATGYVLPGDVFFDFGQDGAWDKAVTTVGASAGHVWSGSGDWYLAPLILYTDQGPYRVDQGMATDHGPGAGFAYNADAYGPEHWVIELAFDLNGAEYASLMANGVTAHWTYVCGNDVLELPYSPVVPEPASLVIFGLGLAGFFTRRHFAA
jgi:hypothetical protein